MKQKPTSAAEATPVRVVIVTLDSHLASATERAHHAMLRELPGLRLSLHAASEWSDDPGALARCHEDIEQGDVIVVTMMFMEDHIRAVLPALQARREHCDALVVCMSAGEVVKLTRMGRLDMSGPPSGPLAMLRKLRGRSQASSGGATPGARQMSMLRGIPKLLRFIPGTAQDLRAYFLSMQCWLAGSEDNIANLVRLLVGRYAGGERAALRAGLNAGAPANYPDVGLYHPALAERITSDPRRLPAPRQARGTVGVLIMRSYVLAGNAAHYDGVIAALEAQGLRVVPAFASGLDARPAIEKFFLRDGVATIDAMLSLTGFSLVGGPAYNDAHAAEEILARLDVPYVGAMPVEFQTVEQWEQSERGLLPVESTIMVAIPELDGATAPMVFGGRASDASGQRSRDMSSHPERAQALAERVARLVRLRRSERRQRKVAIVLFNFPPNAGNAGTAAFLSVFASLHRTLLALRDGGYDVQVPETIDALRERIIEGNAARHGTYANVAHRVPVGEHVKRETWLADIERHWGPAPGKILADGASIFVLGAHFGNVFVGVQPGFGVEGDPMRLLFEGSYAPTHAFSAFYRYLATDFGADAVLHFGTHGALEFMPGKQVGLSAACWPERLLGPLPNVYLYASNNPSEGTIAKRRSAATLVSYLTPPITRAGLYQGLTDLKGSIGHWRSLGPDAGRQPDLAAMIQAQAAALELAAAEPAWPAEEVDVRIGHLATEVARIEQTLIPHGMHVLGQASTAAQRIDLLEAMAGIDGGTEGGSALPRRAIEALVEGQTPEQALALAQATAAPEVLQRMREMAEANRLLTQDHEIPGLLHALDGGFIRPAPGGDLVRTPAVLPTGRNLHGFDPFRIPSAYAVVDGARQAARLLARLADDGRTLPESVAMVLWGTDNLKTEGAPIAQALALMGARPRFDTYGRLVGAELVPLADLGRPRIDVVMTLSGIFRDLMPLQIRMLAEAALLAASADEPPQSNFIRKHTLAYQAEHGCDLETAALRVYSNADGSYGANVNQLVDSGSWQDEDELGEAYSRRKCYAYGRAGRPMSQPALLRSALADVEIAYQSLESVELGVTTVDHYFDSLGGISRAAKKAGKREVGVYISDQTQGADCVRTLAEQVTLESRTRLLNPKFYEGLLEHGYEGVRQIEAHVTNTVGWSATTGQVAPWIYQQLTKTFVLDPAMRDRLGKLNPAASAKVANRLIEAHERRYWEPDEATLKALREAGNELEDRLEGVATELDVRMAA
jgi:magnesium chelatase subunit H